MPTPDAFDPNAPAIPDEIRETLFTKPAFAIGEPTKALGNALRDNATLRARIAELEARLSLAEKVVEAAIWKVGDDGQTQCAICGRYNDSHEAYCVLADYRAKYKS